MKNIFYFFLLFALFWVMLYALSGAMEKQEEADCQTWHNWEHNGSGWEAKDWQQEQCSIYQTKL